MVEKGKGLANAAVFSYDKKIQHFNNGNKDERTNIDNMMRKNAKDVMGETKNKKCGITMRDATCGSKEDMKCSNGRKEERKSW